MPRNTREYLLRYTDQALNDLDRALEELAKLKGSYEPSHPQYAKYVELVAMQVTAASEDLKKFRTQFM